MVIMPELGVVTKWVVKSTSTSCMATTWQGSSPVFNLDVRQGTVPGQINLALIKASARVL
jgi:hypothetical protein